MKYGIHPRKLLGNAGVLSCSGKEPRYVLGAYWRCSVRRRTKKTATIAREIRRVGTSVDTRPDSEEEP